MSSFCYTIRAFHAFDFVIRILKERHTLLFILQKNLF